MRWIFSVLLMVNAIVFFYALFLAFWGELIHGQSGPDRLGTPISGGTPLMLLDERGPRSTPIETVRLRSVRGDGGIIVAPQETEGLCTLIGVFSSRAEARRFAGRLSILGIKSTVKSRLVSAALGFWLYLPPEFSRKEMLRRLSELQRQGVDSYIIPDGELAQGISLGMFSERERAESLKGAISRLGYQPQVLVVPREKREVWVLLPDSESTKINEKHWLELLSGEELLQKQQNLCSDVASA